MEQNYATVTLCVRHFDMYISQLGANSALHPTEVAKSSTGFAEM